MMAFLLAQQVLSSHAFSPAVSSRTRPATAVFFRENHENTPGSVESFVFSPQQQSSELPPWLAEPKSQQEIDTLRRSMIDSKFFTEAETQQLVTTIEQLTNGDVQLQAGTAEFCLLLVDQMELGAQTILAAGLHYVTCVHARRMGRTGVDYTDVAERLLAQVSVEESVQNIVKDAARLKQLEVLAASVDQRTRADAMHAETVRKLLLSETKDWRALAIRSAASLYRLRGCDPQRVTPECISAAREALHVFAPLASRLGMHRLKNELEGTAFRLLYKRQYQAVNSQTNIASSMQTVLTQVQEDMQDMLVNDKEFNDLVEDFQVTARVKEPYSMWKKMLHHGYRSILQVPDAIALRIVLNAKKLTPDEAASVVRARERALCYYAQKLCLQRWQPFAPQPRFKDYIEHPKRNGYQSLHYTAETSVTNKNWRLEIQVRSGEMNRVAEFGLASHWDYKAQQFDTGKKMLKVEKVESSIDESSDAYLRKLQEWHWQQHGRASEPESQTVTTQSVTLSDIWQSSIREDRIKARSQQLEPYIQALNEAQSDLAREFVFVFLTPSDKKGASIGKVLALPAGACVLDALREEEKTIGRPLTGMDSQLALNGVATSITRQLSNGDVLTLPLPSTRMAAVSM
jgi:(p)ppGpp synthase/HD superfamily hydrolase